jgi:7-carboxy-7-deazaguanine synthase
MQTESANRKGALFRICEIYPSIQGEGLLSGTASVFVRTSGCNLRCWFCDTPFSSWRPEGNYQSAQEIVQQVRSFQATHVVLTGGEPMIFPTIGQLTQAIRAASCHLTIETAGTIWHPVECDLWSISPKLEGSAPKSSGQNWQLAHHKRRQRPDVVRQMMQQAYQLKFVVDNIGDAEEVLRYLEQLGPYDSKRVLLMPQGTTVDALDQHARWLEPWCQKHDLVYCTRSHIYWFGNRRGT